jgi:hypothetical protein
VAVNNHLTCLCDGASEARTKYECVETHFEKLNQVLTGKAFLTLSFFESLAKLSFTHSVLSAKTLLLAKTNGEVAVSLLLVASVLAWAEWALL